MDRIEDEILCKQYTDAFCAVCNQIPPNDPHHLKSRGSWGPDLNENLVTLCRTHHVEIHAYGINKFIGFYPKFEPLIREKGWYPETIGTGRNAIVKWFNDSVRC